MDAIIQFLNDLGYEVIGQKMYSYMNSWLDWYAGNVKDFHSYQYYTGNEYIDMERYTLGMPKMACECMADLLMNDNVFITTDVDEIIKPVLEDEENDFIDNMNELIEMYGALGTGALIEFKEDNQTKIDYVIAPMIFPLRVKRGNIIDCAFASKIDENSYYVNIHEKQKNGFYKIQNKYFTLLKDKKIKETKAPKGIKEVEYSEEKLFQIIKPKIKNNIDLFSPFGISIFGNAISETKTVDIIYDGFRNEFETGKNRVFVKTSVTQMKPGPDGKMVPYWDKRQTEFYPIPEDGEQGKPIEVSNVELRTTSYIDGLQTALNLFGDKCGFGSDYFTFKDGKVYTNSTQVISTQSKLFKTIKKHEKNLLKAIKGMVKGIYYLETGKLYTGDTTVDFDDSIIEDKKEIRAQAMSEYNVELIDSVQYYQDVYKMTKEQAIEFDKEIKERQPKEEPEETPPDEE